MENEFRLLLSSGSSTYQLIVGSGNQVAILSAFLDESGTDARSPVTYVGGYLFDEAGQASFTSAWVSIWKPFHERGFDNFHANDWANPNSQFFKSTTEDEREKVLFDLIDLIRSTAKHGGISSITEDDYQRSTVKNVSSYLTGSKYTACALRTIFLFSGCVTPSDSINFMFESGYEFAGEADHMMKAIKKKREVAQRLRYENHGFLPKSSLPPLQAADALLWLWNRHQVDSKYDRFLNRLRAPGGVKTYIQEVTEMSLDFLAIHNNSLGIESNRKHPRPQGNTRTFLM